jgi:hypothetical protein
LASTSNHGRRPGRPDLARGNPRPTPHPRWSERAIQSVRHRRPARGDDLQGNGSRGRLRKHSAGCRRRGATGPHANSRRPGSCPRAAHQRRAVGSEPMASSFISHETFVVEEHRKIFVLRNQYRIFDSSGAWMPACGCIWVHGSSVPSAPGMPSPLAAGRSASPRWAARHVQPRRCWTTQGFPPPASGTCSGPSPHSSCAM